jgi:flagellar protein FlaJ
MLWLLPLLFALVLLAPVALSPVSKRADLIISRVALPIFGFHVSNRSSRRTTQEHLLRSAYLGETHRVYAARTLLIAALFAISGSIIGVYLAAGVLTLMAINHELIVAALPGPLTFLAGLATLESASATELFLLLLFSSATIGMALSLGTYWLRWQLVQQQADVRARDIDATLPRTVAFIYALSRSGMAFPKVMETLTENQVVYGEAAREIGLAVREMNVFGSDMLTALQRMASRSPSDNMEEFGENLASVLGSGRNLSDFLREQYEQYQEEAEAQQEQYLDLLSTFAEVYVTVFVAGPLFFITVLVIVGLVIQDTLTLTRVIGYAAIPLASAAFAVYIDSIIGSFREEIGEKAEDDIALALQGENTSDTTPEFSADFTARSSTGSSTHAATDGGVAERNQRNRERLAAYDRFEPLRGWVVNPIASLRHRPGATLVVTVPLALLWMNVRIETIPADPMGALAAIDSPLMESTLLILGVFAFVYELKQRRERAIEDAVPDLLDRMASVNEAGMTVVESIHRVTRSDLGALTFEIQRTWRDIKWGADAERALKRLDQRTQTVAVTQAVTLLTNAMQASGDIAPVLRIAADEAHQSRRLRRERRQEMLTYQLVIYIAFLVFLGIIIALAVAFIPAVESAGSIGMDGTQEMAGSMSTGLFAGIGDVNTEAYTLLFSHIAAIQAVCSGLIAGQLGEGGIYDGTKHATVMLALAYVVFTLV